MANDPEEDPVVYSLGTGAPTGATLDPVTGRFQWTPTEAQSPGSYTIQVIASDNRTPVASAQASFVITVSERNDAPVFAPVGDKTVAEHNLLSIPILAVDPELGPVTYALLEMCQVALRFTALAVSSNGLRVNCKAVRRLSSPFKPLIAVHRP